MESPLGLHHCQWSLMRTHCVWTPPLRLNWVSTESHLSQLSLNWVSTGFPSLPMKLNEDKLCLTDPSVKTQLSLNWDSLGSIEFKLSCNWVSITASDAQWGHIVSDWPLDWDNWVSIEFHLGQLSLNWFSTGSPSLPMKLNEDTLHLTDPLVETQLTILCAENLSTLNLHYLHYLHYRPHLQLSTTSKSSIRAATGCSCFNTASKRAAKQRHCGPLFHFSKISVSRLSVAWKLQTSELGFSHFAHSVEWVN